MKKIDELYDEKRKLQRQLKKFEDITLKKKRMIEQQEEFINYFSKQDISVDNNLTRAFNFLAAEIDQLKSDFYRINEVIEHQKTELNRKIIDLEEKEMK